MRLFPAVVVLALLPLVLPAFPVMTRGASTPEKTPFKRWAIIASPELCNAGLTDLIASRLAKTQDMELLSREHLQALTEEQKIRLLSGGGADRGLKAGRILKADALALLSLAQGKEQSVVRLVISDSLYGARLKTELFAFNPEKLEESANAIADAIVQTRAQFAGGIRRLIAVPHFISRDLNHRYDHMQAGSATLLAEALRQYPGVAVIETEEALAIRRELELSGDQLHDRKVPLLVEGEYQTFLAAKGARTISFFIQITNGKKAAAQLRRERLSLSEAQVYLTGDLCREISQKASIAPGILLDSRQQFDALVRRADAFAEVGSWHHSTGLREAALLLKEDAAEQRILLLKEYARIISFNYGHVPITRETIQRKIMQRAEMWLSGLSHLEYLIHNRLVSLPHATELARNFLPTFHGHFYRGHQMPFDYFDEEVEFFRRVIPAGDSLPPEENHGRLNVTHGLRGLMLQHVLKRTFDPRTFSNLKERDHKREFGILLEVMEKWVPEDMYALGIFYCPLGDINHRGRDADKYRDFLQAYIEFLHGLARSKQPYHVFCARYGLLMYDYKADGTPTEKRLAEFDSLNDLFQDLPVEVRHARTGRFLSEQLTNYRRNVSRQLHPEKQTTTTRYNIPRTPPKKDFGPVRFKLLEMKVRKKDGSLVDFNGQEWRSYGGRVSMQHWTACGPKVDVLWNSAAVLLIRTPGVAEELFVDKVRTFSDVKWDGRHIWIATRLSGVWILEPTGEVVARIDDSHGLPSADNGVHVLLHPLDKGRMAAVGSFGPHGRAWCAMVTFKDNQPKVNVFHRAVKVMQPDKDNRLTTSARDPMTVFSPSWMHVFQPAGENQSPRLLIGRGDHPRGWFPLSVDLKTLKVEGYPGSWPDACFPGPDGHSASYFSRNGKLLVAGSRHGAAVYEPVDNGLLFSRVRASHYSHYGNADRGTFVKQGNWIYCAAYRWSRFNPDTLEEEVLSPDRLPLGFNKLYVAQSSHHGIIAMQGSTIYRVTILEEKDSADKTSSPENVPATKGN